MYLLRPQKKRQKLDLILTFAIGLLLGAFISRLLQYTKRNIWNTSTAVSDTTTSITSMPNSLIFQSNSDTHTLPYYNQKGRILCIVSTTPKQQKTRVRYIRNTWGKRCHKLLFMSTESATDSDLNTIIKLNVANGYSNLWNKTREIWHYIYDKHINDADWFLKVDDDAYVIMENLQRFLQTHSTTAPIYFESNSNAYSKLTSQQSYVLSKTALRRFMEQAYSNSKICRSLPWGTVNIELSRCLQNVGVFAAESRDIQQLLTFVPYSPLRAFSGAHTETNYQKTQQKCCSTRAIAFHNIYDNEFEILEYMIYKLRPFGLEI